jgi:hypothetical protein
MCIIDPVIWSLTYGASSCALVILRSSVTQIKRAHNVTNCKRITNIVSDRKPPLHFDWHMYTQIVKL